MNKPERKLNVFQSVAIIIASTIGAILGLIIAFWPGEADAQRAPLQCYNIRTACNVTSSTAVFADNNGTVCDPNVDKNVGCYIRGYSLRYNYKGTEYAYWSSTRLSVVYREEEVCFDPNQQQQQF